MIWAQTKLKVYNTSQSISLKGNLMTVHEMKSRTRSYLVTLSATVLVDAVM